MSRPVSRTRRFWYWLDGTDARGRAAVIRATPPLAPEREPRRAPATPPAATGEGVAAKARGDRRAALVSAFDPAHPIRHARDLRGRKEALDALAEAMLWQRQHAVVHGPRGSGKTSLVRVFADRADRQGVVLIYVSCEASARFADLLRPLLQTIPASNMAVGDEPAFRAEIAALPPAFTPQAAVALLNTLAAKPIVFILDEFDRVTDRGVRDQIATFMKLLSDTLSPVQVLAVGIAASVDDLIVGHPSLRRHLTAIGIGPIADREIDRLIVEGGARAQLPFGGEARALIVATACGSPYHARVFAYAAGMHALARQAEEVAQDDARQGLRSAFERWARLNRGDAALFGALAEQDAAARRLLAAETQAIARDRPQPAAAHADAERARLLLASALTAPPEGSRPLFRDETAAQYLLAALALAPEGPSERIRG